MLIPFSWLKDFVKINASAEKLAEKLLLSGTKVERIKKVGKEHILELEITPNRPDTLSIYGVAREIAVLTAEDLLPLDTEMLLPSGKLANPPNLKVSDKKLCPSYTYGLVRDVSVKNSPSWLAERLELAGIRPINNVVDITNYVMLETGQPMHAFDTDEIEGDLTLRTSEEGESVRTLDGVLRKLPSGSLIIEDSKKLIDLAGLMGGKNSEIKKTTKNLLLLVPIYDPVAIRRASQATALRTESSNRFEKKLDLLGTKIAFERALKLLTEVAGGKLATAPRTSVSAKESRLELPVELFKQTLGIEIPLPKIINILSSLGFRVSVDPFRDRFLHAVVPSWRRDIDSAIDLTEEVGRIYGYNLFPKTLPAGNPPIQPELFHFGWEKETRQIFKAAGFTELLTFTLTSEEQLKRAGLPEEKIVRIANPMSKDFEILRPTLLTELLNAVAKNLKYEGDLSFFEIGKIFYQEGEIKQPKILGAITTKSFLELKGVLEKVVSRSGDEQEYSVSENGLIFKTKGFKLARILVVDEGALKNFEIPFSLTYAEIYLDDLETLPAKFTYHPLAKFPPVIEDISMFLSNKIAVSEILSEIQKAPLVAEATIFDIFEKNGRKSIAVRITYQAKDRTLTDTEVAKVRKEIVGNLKRKFEAEIRSR